MAVLNQNDGTSGLPKLSEVLFERRDRSFGSIAPLPSNVGAIESSLLFAAGMNPFVAVVGPSGWGKSHLLDAVSYRLSHDFGLAPEPLAARDFLSNPSRLDTAAPLLLDDVQEILAKPRQRMTLRLCLERRLRAGRATMLSFTLPKLTRPVRNFLPCGREWSVATVGAPEPEERMLLLSHMSAAEGLALSPGLIKVIAYQMHGNGRTLAGALKRLRLSGTTWLDARSTLRACGLLDPFFADNSAWDLKMRILKIAEQSRPQFSRVNATDLALYTMLHEAGLSEADVARSAGIQPADAYQRASRFQKQAEADEATAAYVRQFVDVVVGTLPIEEGVRSQGSGARFLE